MFPGLLLRRQVGAFSETRNDECIDTINLAQSTFASNVSADNESFTAFSDNILATLVLSSVSVHVAQRFFIVAQ